MGPCPRLFWKEAEYPLAPLSRLQKTVRETGNARTEKEDVYARFRKWSAIVRLDNSPFVKRMVRMRIFARKKVHFRGSGE
jgi:hypothetical protein